MTRRNLIERVADAPGPRVTKKEYAPLIRLGRSVNPVFDHRTSRSASHAVPFVGINARATQNVEPFATERQ